MPYIGNTAADRFVASKAATQFSGDGSTTAFTLEHSVGADEDILVSVDGVVQEPSVAYAVSNGTTLTFTAAPSSNSGNNIFVYYLFRTVATVSHPSNQALSATSGTFSGAVTANAGVVVDNITIDGTEIDLSSGDLTVDSAGQIILDYGSGAVLVKAGGTDIGKLHNSSTDFVIESITSDEDILFKGNDGGSNITALTLDMSDAGSAYFNGNIYIAEYLVHNGDNNTFLQFTTDQVNIFAGNENTIQCNYNAVVINEASQNIDFRVESEDNANCFFVDASGNQMGFGQAPDITDNGAYMFVGAADATTAHLVLANTQTSDVNALLFLNRQNADGDLVNFRQANSLEGRISVSGSTVTYHGFSGQHESSGIDTNTALGTVVSTIDELDTYPSTQSDTVGSNETHPKAGQTRADHPKVKISDTVGDACVYGVVAEFTKQDKVMIASVGIGSVRVTGACSKGDLLESNGDGTAKVQSDDIIRSKTIGKVTIGNSTTDVKLVSCVLYCG